MELNVLFAILLSVTVFLFMYLFGAMFLFGKGGFLVAGYHFEPKGEKAKVYHNYIMRRLGLWALLLIATIHICTVCGLLGYKIVCYVFVGLMIAETIFGIVWFNFSKKIKNAMKMERELSKEFEIEQKEKNAINNQ